MINVLRFINLLCAFTILVITILGFFERPEFMFFLAQNARWQILILSILTLFCAFLFYRPEKHQSKVAIAITSLCILVNSFYVIPLYIKPDIVQTTGTKIKILMANVQMLNPDKAKLIALINKEKPDIFIGVEINKSWVENTKVLKNLYPYYFLNPQENYFGSLIYSKYPFTETAKLYLTNPAFPVLRTTIIADSKEVVVYIVHPPAPMNKFYYKNWQETFSKLKYYVKKENSPVIIAGDLNTTPFSYKFRNLLSETSLVDTRNGYGLSPTWCVYFHDFIMLPLDYILQKGLKTVSFKICPTINSDHFPLAATLILPDDS